jgi:glycine cleavage system pyridoxal-binding protein P
LDIEVTVGDPKQLNDLKEETYFGALLQYPGNDGAVNDFSQEIVSMH